MSENINISVVIPLLNEQDSLPELCSWIEKVMEENKFTYEVILIDDGSTDGSWDFIEEKAKNNNRFKGIKFNRNYGKAAALNVGFGECLGDVVITMDADLQDSPDEIPQLYKMITQDKFDLVSGWKKKRYDPVLSKNIPSKFYNWTVRKMSKINLHDFNCGLKAYRKAVVKSISVYGDMHRYIPVLAKWAGYNKIGEKVVQHQERKYGQTKYGIERFIRGPLDLLSIMFISKFGKRPMHFFGPMGALSFLLGLIITIWIIADKLYHQKILHETTRSVTDRPAFFLALLVIVIGTQLFLAGFLAELVTTNSARKNDYLISGKTGK